MKLITITFPFYFVFNFVSKNIVQYVFISTLKNENEKKHVAHQCQQVLRTQSFSMVSLINECVNIRKRMFGGPAVSTHTSYPGFFSTYAEVVITFLFYHTPEKKILFVNEY